MATTFRIYERDEPCRILAVHDFGTVDVERLSDGRYFRITGLTDTPGTRIESPETPSLEE